MEGKEFYPPVETHLIASRFVKQTFKVQVLQPVQKRDEQTRFPVVYATDGNMNFDVLKGLSWAIQSSACEGSRFILVSIGYPGDCPLAGVALRTRDLSFSQYPRIPIPIPAVDGVLLPEPGAKDFYGAEEFQAFIEQELMPLIDEKYLTLTADRTYFGHSMGAGFGLYTLFTKPDLFRNYIASSPGLIYHGEGAAGTRYEHYDFVPRYVGQFIKSGEALHGVSLYLSVGAEEEFEPALAEWRLTSSFYQLARLMKEAAIPGLRLITQVFPNAIHSTAWPMAFLLGVPAVLRVESSIEGD